MNFFLILKVNTLADFFVDDFIFIAYGTERICCDDFNVVSEGFIFIIFLKFLNKI
jgi:hypothetical protein